MQWKPAIGNSMDSWKDIIKQNKQALSDKYYIFLCRS